MSSQSTPPFFELSLAEIVPPVIIIAIFGFFESFFTSISSFFSENFLTSLISKISFLLKPMLYPESSFKRTIPLSVSGISNKTPS